jgi:hypothetical protein
VRNLGSHEELDPGPTDRLHILPERTTSIRLYVMMLEINLYLPKGVRMGFKGSD